MRFPSSASALLFVAAFLRTREAYAETAVAVDAEAVDYTQVDLNTLTNDELAAICTDRGFELVFELDDATEESLEYTHEDYVDAARECLKLEAEMEAFYEENPEMLREMEEERERMMKEQEELEQKLKEAQDKLDKRKAKKAPEGGAFVKKAKEGEEAGDDDAARECLKLEAEMEAFYEENPEMLREMEEERERMMKEQEELEQKLKEAQDKLDKRKAKKAPEGGAFVKKAKEGEEAGDDEIDATIDNNQVTNEESQKDNQKDELPADDEVIDLDNIMNEVIESQQTKDEHSNDGTKAEPKDTSSAEVDSAPSITASTSDDGLIIEFKEVYAEFCEKVRQDFATIANIVVPKPLRGPLKEGLRKGFSIAKDASSDILGRVKSSGLYDKVKQDLIRIVDIVVPQAAREPLRKGLKTGVKIAKDGAIKGADMAKRYGAALLEKGMASYKKIQQEQEERREREQKEAAEGATAAA